MIFELGVIAACNDRGVVVAEVRKGIRNITAGLLETGRGLQITAAVYGDKQFIEIVFF